ncbi:MAG: histidinol-phosphate aminotransferase family protein [Gemmatimonadaceae bacterium]|nr:histidinol-phosphate aminotransferase family protein [Gemmatimonadaceae bacterium]
MTVPTADRLSIARACYDDLTLYDPRRAPVDLDLTDNTNLWGVPPAAARAIRDCSAATITRYPSLYCADLKAAIAAHAGVTADMVVTGCGSDDILDASLRAFGDAGDLVAAPDPTFAMVPILARMNALRSVLLTELPDHEADADALLATGAKIIYLCSPNNPTGALVARRTLETLVDNAPGLLVIDEAYVEFAGVSNVDLLQRSPRVLLVRTMSKAFGLAGLRVGYALGHPSLVREVEKARGPYKVSALAERVAATALRDDVQWVLEHIQLAVENRDRLTIELLKLGLDPIPSSANFVCVPVPDAVATSVAMRERGVGVRPFPYLPRVGDCLRISVGPWPLVAQAVKVLGTVLRRRKPGRTA